MKIWGFYSDFMDVGILSSIWICRLDWIVIEIKKEWSVVLGDFSKEEESYEVWNFFFFPGDKSVLKDLVYWDEDCMGIYIRRTTMSKVGIID